MLYVVCYSEHSLLVSVSVKLMAFMASLKYNHFGAMVQYLSNTFHDVNAKHSIPGLSHMRILQYLWHYRYMHQLHIIKSIVILYIETLVQ